MKPKLPFHQYPAQSGVICRFCFILFCAILSQQAVDSQKPVPAGKASGKAEKKVKKRAFPPAATNREERKMRQVFRMSLRRAKKDPGKRVKAIEALLKKSHQRFVKPVKKLVTSDRSPQVQSAALKGLGQLNYPESRASLLKMLGRKDFWERRHMLLDALSGLERMGYHHSHFAPMKALFEKGLESKDWFKVQVKILGMLRLARDSQAFSFLLEHLEPPTPKDVNAADNPPASYWEKRWKIWQVWKQEVKKTLFALTLKRFTKAEAYRKWALTKEGRKRLAATDWQRRKKKK